MSQTTSFLTRTALNRRHFVGRTSLAAAGVVAGLSRVRSAPAQDDASILTFAIGTDASVLDPHKSLASTEAAILLSLFDTLTTFDDNMELQPLAATSWELLDDTTWQFKIREGITFHNGDPLTASDVKFSIERARQEGSYVYTVFPLVEGVDIVDPLTVNIRNSRPDPLLPKRLAYFAGEILPEKYVREVGDEQFNLNPVGSGPVKFVEWVRDDHITLAKNEAYWGKKVDFDQVVFRPIPELAARVAALVNGEVDIVTQLSPDNVEQVEASENAKILKTLYAGLYVLGVNANRPPLDKKEIKQALSLAIDRESILQNLWNGEGVVPNGPIATTDFAYDPDLPPLPYDPDQARSLMDQAGYAGETIYLENTIGYLPNEQIMSEAIIEMWRDVGFTAELETLEFAVRGQKSREKAFKGLWWSDPTSTLLDPDGVVWRLVGPGGAMEYWTDPEFQRIGNEARYSTDEQVRRDAYRRLTEIFNENNPWISILQPMLFFGTAEDIQWKPRGNFHVTLNSITRSS